MDSNKIEKATAPTKLNTSIQDVKAARALRKAISPIAVLAIIVNMLALVLIFAWVLLSSSPNWVTNLDQQKGIVEALAGVEGIFTTISKIAAILAVVFDFVVCGLFLSESIVTGIKLNKNNLKSELPTIAVKGVVAILFLIFVILALVGVAGGDKWSISSEMYNKTWYWMGENIHKTIMYIGLCFALLVFARMYSKVYSKKVFAELTSNKKLTKAISFFSLESIICLVLPVGIAIGGGFVGRTIIDSSITDAAKIILPVIKNDLWMSGIVIGQFIVPVLAFIAFGILIQGGLPFVENRNDKIKLAIIYGILFVIALVFWILNVVFLKLDTDFEAGKWFDSDTSSKSCAVIVMLGWMFTLAVSIANMIITGQNAKVKKEIKQVETK